MPVIVVERRSFGDGRSGGEEFAVTKHVELHDGIRWPNRLLTGERTWPCSHSRVELARVLCLHPGVPGLPTEAVAVPALPGS